MHGSSEATNAVTGAAVVTPAAVGDVEDVEAPRWGSARPGLEPGAHRLTRRSAQAAEAAAGGTAQSTS